VADATASSVLDLDLDTCDLQKPALSRVVDAELTCNEFNRESSVNSDLMGVLVK